IGSGGVEVAQSPGPTQGGFRSIAPARAAPRAASPTAGAHPMAAAGLHRGPAPLSLRARVSGPTPARRPLAQRPPAGSEPEIQQLLEVRRQFNELESVVLDLENTALLLSTEGHHQIVATAGDLAEHHAIVNPARQQFLFLLFAQPLEPAAQIFIQKLPL